MSLTVLFQKLSVYNNLLTLKIVDIWKKQKKYL